MPILRIDLETYSSVDLLKSGVYRYAEAPDFQILLISYAVDADPVTLIDLTCEPFPEDLLEKITDKEYVKVAANANFERICLSQWMKNTLTEQERFELGFQGLYLAPEQWHCSLVHAATLGLPRSLADIGAALGLPEDKQKMKEGKDLIRYFCVPCKPTKTNKGRTRNMPWHAPEKWATFKAYNIRDVETEREIDLILDQYPVRDEEWEAYWLDQHINDNGVGVDIEFANAAIALNVAHAAELADEAGMLTGLDNVKSVAQLKRYLGHEGSLNKETVDALRKSGDLDGDADRVLAIRQELGKTSVTKYEAMVRCVCADGRVRGLFQFYGANRTGRWAGRQVQVQNLPKNYLNDLELAREIVREGDRDELQALFGNVSSTLSELIRTAFVAREGCTFVVADFSAIEARVIAWLADEEWRKEVFRQGKDIYCASASQMFKVPVEKHGVNGHLRQKGKIAELALGYGGGPGAMKNMGALKMGLAEEELQPIVNAWREANPSIVNLWWEIDHAARDTITHPCDAWRMDLPHGLSMRATRKLLHIKLPSGRELRYWKPRLEKDSMGRENISYGGMDAGRWDRVFSYGPKLVENIVQAIARDCLRDAMKNIFAWQDCIVMHVHDEVIVEVPEEEAAYVLDKLLGIMRQPIGWAPGLVLKGDGYITPFYKKD